MKFRVLGICGALAVCLSAGASVSAATWTPKGAANPLAAVQIGLQPSGPCFQNNFKPTATCPITYKLQSRLRIVLKIQARGGPHSGPPNYICRCNGNTLYTHFAVTTKPSGATVVASGSKYAGDMTFLLVHWKVGWLINNSYCDSNPMTDMYHGSQPAACKP